MGAKLSGTYEAKGGESWGTVARRTTGNDMDAAAIQRANAGYSVPLLAGAIVHIPQWEKLDTNGLSDDPLTIKIDGQRIGTFNGFEMATSIDACAKGRFVIPNTPETRDMFPPLSFPIVTVDSYGERLFTGRADDQQSNDSPSEKTATVSIWSDPAILESAPAPNSAFPLQWEDATLETIAGDLASLHGVTINYDADDRARFKRVDIKQGDAILGFIQNLSAQRGLLLASNEIGELLIHDGTGGELVSYIEKGKLPCVSMSVSINSAAYKSSVTVTMPSKSKRGKKGSSHQVVNPVVASGIIRPHHFEASDIDPGELQLAAKSVAGRMFAEIVTASTGVATWKNDIGQLYRPGQLVKIKSEDDRVYSPFVFQVAMVNFSHDAGSEMAELNLVLPGVYSGEIPEVMPWQR